jgi:hypothetical protein
MGLKDLKRRLTASVNDLDRARLQDRYAGLDLTPIGDAPARRPVRLGGEVQGCQLAAHAGQNCLEIVVSDGTGKATAIFTGRRRIKGLTPGRGVLLEGVGREDNGRLVLLNPAYTLLD